MDVQANHVIDAGTKGADGLYDYYYAYTDFVVEEAGLKAGFRLDDGSDELLIDWIEENGSRKLVKWGESYGAMTFPRDSLPMARVLCYFRDSHKVRCVKAFDGPVGGYTAKDIDDLVASNNALERTRNG